MIAIRFKILWNYIYLELIQFFNHEHSTFEYMSTHSDQQYGCDQRMTEYIVLWMEEKVVFIDQDRKEDKKTKSE